MSHLDTLFLTGLYSSTRVATCSVPSKINAALECSGQILTNSFKLKVHLPEPDKNKGVSGDRGQITGEEERFTISTLGIFFLPQKAIFNKVHKHLCNLYIIFSNYLLLEYFIMTV